MSGNAQEEVQVDASASDAAVLELFAGPGEVRALARTLDWGASPIGWPDGWSPALRIAVRAMLDSPFPICLWSGPSFALVYNDAYRRVLAAKHPAALGQPGADVWAEIWAQVAPQFEQVRAGGPPIYFESAKFEMARLEGGATENAWFDYSLSALRDDDGSVAAILNISPETTGRIRAERALEVERARLEQVFRRAPSFIVAFRGPELVYEFVNEAYYQLVGHREILGKPLLQAIPEIRDQGFDALLTRVLRTGEPWVGREAAVLLQRTPGAALETRYLDMVFQPLTEADGTHSGVVAHGGDITEQVLARREVERARDRADRLQRLTAALAATSTLAGVADVVAEQGVSAGTSTAMLALREPAETADDEDHLIILRQTGIEPELIAPYRRYPLSSATPTAASIRGTAPIFIEDGATLRSSFPALTHVWDRLGTQALVSVPLAAGHEIVGGIAFTYASAHDFSEEERAFFTAVGRQVAQALERVRLAEAERTARDRAEALQRVTAALARARTLSDVGRVFSYELTTLVGADTAWVGVVTPDGSAVEALGWSGYPATTADRWRRLAIDAHVALAESVRLSRPQWWSTREEIVREYPGRAGVVRSIDQEGVAVLPIMPGTEPGDGTAARAIGGIVVGYLTPQRFEAGRRTFFLALAQQCGLAIERARAYEAEQAARVEAESARRAAEAASRAKSEFLAVMSHELRTPLNAIGGYAELMEMGLRGGVTSEQRSDLERIQRAQRHLLGLINGVLNYAKVDAGAVHYELADVVVDEVLATCEALVAPQTHVKRLTLRRVPSPGDGRITVRADREKLQQIVLNLLSNAVKFTESGGEISLDCIAHPESVAVRVTDTGRGIASDHLERVFQPFVQVDSTLTRTQEGTGLGLAISRDLARGMGGDLTVTSSPGVGSTFTLSLPR